MQERTSISAIIREGLSELPGLVKDAGAAAAQALIGRPESVRPLAADIAERADITVTPQQ